MNRKDSEKKPRTRRKDSALSAFSESNTQTTPAIILSNLIHFYEPFKCRNKTQKDFLNLINDKEIVIASGPAGVGKSYVPIARALELLKSTSTPYSKIIISKPAVEADEKHGFVPGTIREKMEPYVASSLDIFDELIGKANRLKLEESEHLLIQPLAYIRGKSINNTILVMEECQNMSPKQMKTLLTRIGYNSKFILSGDLEQSDRYYNINQSGLYDAIEKHKNTPEIGFVQFTEDEIVRNPLITKILKNYKVPEKKQEFVKSEPKKAEKKTLIQKFLKMFK